MKNAIKLVLFNLGLLLGGLLLAELCFGSWFSSQNYGALNLPRNVKRVFDVSHIYPQKEMAVYSRDSHGLRGEYKSPAEIDILTIGGSTTDQRYIGDGFTLQDQLEANFTKNGKNTTIVNAGVDGQTTIGNLALFDLWFPKIPSLKPRYILVYTGINDVFADEVAKHDAMLSPSLSRQVEQYFRNNSALFRAYNIIKGMIKAERAGLVHGKHKEEADNWVLLPKNYIFSSEVIAYESRAQAFGERVEKLIKKIRDFGAEAIIVSQARSEYRLVADGVMVPLAKNGNPNADTYGILRSFNQESMLVCRNAKAICIDLGNEINLGEGDYYDHVHNTPRGAAKIGQYLYEKLNGVR